MSRFQFDHKDAEKRAQVPIDHLVNIGGRCLWQKDTSDASKRVECWIGATVNLYVVIFNTDGGWEIFKPVSMSNNIAPTLAAVK